MTCDREISKTPGAYKIEIPPPPVILNALMLDSLPPPPSILNVLILELLTFWRALVCISVHQLCKNTISTFPRGNFKIFFIFNLHVSGQMLCQH